MNRRDPFSPSYRLDNRTLRQLDVNRELFWFADLNVKEGSPRLVWPVVFNTRSGLDTALQILGPAVHEGKTVQLRYGVCKAGSPLARACRANPVKLDKLTEIVLVDLMKFTEPFKDG